jgi:hypothetical protein
MSGAAEARNSYRERDRQSRFGDAAPFEGMG